MHVIEVIPLVRASQIETLTYYSSIAYPAGTIIDVPIRKQAKRAVVVDAKPVSVSKTAVKTATFSLRKLPEQPNTNTLPPVLIETARQLMKTTPASLGAILFALLPPEVREGTIDINGSTPPENTFETPSVTVFQGTEEERLRTYRSRIRETFAHRGSVLLVVPTATEVTRLADALSSGIEKRVVTFSSQLSKKKMAAAYADFSDLSHAKLIITTPTYSCVDRHDITDIIIEGARSSHYKAKTRPYLDTRTVLHAMARVTGRNILLGDLLPRSEEEQKRRDDFYNTDGEHPKRLTLPGKLTVITQATQKTASDSWQLFSDELQDIIRDTHKQRGKSMILAARRGMAPLVTCVDCGHVFRCPSSGEPYSLHKTMRNGEEKRWFIAASSGRRLVAPDTCTECGSWRLQERGIGIQHIQAEFKKQFPNIPLVIFDHTTATTSRKAAQIMASFTETKGAVLLATQMVLPHLEHPVTNTILTSLEATRAIPSWRAEESFFALLLRLRELATEATVIQSRTEPDDLLRLAEQGLVEQFYDEELELRASLHYPPHSHFIHLTLQGEPASTKELEKAVTAHLTSYEPRFYSAPQFIKNGIRRYGLLRITNEAWPDPKLMELLRTLPPHVRIEIDPERIV